MSELKPVTIHNEAEAELAESIAFYETFRSHLRAYRITRSLTAPHASKNVHTIQNERKKIHSILKNISTFALVTK